MDEDSECRNYIASGISFLFVLPPQDTDKNLVSEVWLSHSPVNTTRIKLVPSKNLVRLYLVVTPVKLENIIAYISYVGFPS